MESSLLYKMWWTSGKRASRYCEVFKYFVLT